LKSKAPWGTETEDKNKQKHIKILIASVILTPPLAFNFMLKIATYAARKCCTSFY